MASVGIIGGGINGLCTAYFLIKSGAEVTVIDSSNLEDGCSHGNAGYICPSHIIPVAAPGIIANGLKWMLNPTSPFYIRPSFDIQLLKWVWAFFQHANHAHVTKSIPVLRDTLLLSRQLFPTILNDLGDDVQFTEKGLLMLCKTQHALDDEAETARLAIENGLEAKVLDREGVQALEPHIEMDVIGGVFFPGDAHLNPGLLMKALVRFLKSKGVSFVLNSDVVDIKTSGSTVSSLITSSSGPDSVSDLYQFDEIVVSTGAWSPFLYKKLGTNLLLQGGKGYSFKYHDIRQNLSIPAILMEARVAATPLGTSLQFGGTMEIAGLNPSIRMNRVKGIHQAIRQYFPSFDFPMPTESDIWYGFRPCTPDGLPYIGRLSPWNNVSIATGHCMLGLSLGAATGKLMSDMILQNPMDLSVSPFAPNRFQ